MLKIALSTMIFMESKTIYNLNQNIRIINTEKDKIVMTSHGRINQWEKYVGNLFYE